MLQRLLLTAPVGTLITFGLLFLMQALIDSGLSARTPSTRAAPQIYTVKKEDPVREVETEIKPIPKPAELPDFQPPRPTGDTATLIDVGFADPTPPGGSGDLELGIPGGDAPVLAIVRVQPQYPPALAARGIEGYATVRFDVDANGQAVNAQVIDASHSGFERPALKALTRFKFRARVVDGIPVISTGLVNRFRFRLEND